MNILRAMFGGEPEDDVARLDAVLGKLAERAAACGEKQAQAEAWRNELLDRAAAGDSDAEQELPKAAAALAGILADLENIQAMTARQAAKRAAVVNARAEAESQRAAAEDAKVYPALCDDQMRRAEKLDAAAQEFQRCLAAWMEADVARGREFSRRWPRSNEASLHGRTLMALSNVWIHSVPLAIKSFGTAVELSVSLAQNHLTFAAATPRPHPARQKEQAS